MTSGECFENKWFYMKDIGKYLSEEILLTHECSWIGWYVIISYTGYENQISYFKTFWCLQI